MLQDQGWIIKVYGCAMYALIRKGTDDICGVEITENVVAVNENTFRKSIAFLLGNESIIWRHSRNNFLGVKPFMELFPQMNSGLLYNILFPERTNKLLVAEITVNQMMRNYWTETAASVVEERKLKKENASNGFFDEGGKDEAAPTNLLDALFDS
ncbi:uncharacterized protein LOC111392909 [Olea europaea var. sylvestris]|uniref:uncharacterized protein LOC111392909 n=1 Tax=Olea europaea var. sylvestris TaxID=158386 RepID=UPI000C1D0298|nr:uncharacterized protein LOC111392909 [Olea europaea var. sylvestris]